MAAAKPLNSDLKIISGSANPELSKEIAKFLRIPLSDIRISKFPNARHTFK